MSDHEGEHEAKHTPTKQKNNDENILKKKTTMQTNNNAPTT